MFAAGYGELTIHLAVDGSRCPMRRHGQQTIRGLVIRGRVICEQIDLTLKENDHTSTATAINIRHFNFLNYQTIDFLGKLVYNISVLKKQLLAWR